MFRYWRINYKFQLTIIIALGGYIGMKMCLLIYIVITSCCSPITKIIPCNVAVVKIVVGPRRRLLWYIHVYEEAFFTKILSPLKAILCAKGYERKQCYTQTLRQSYSKNCIAPGDLWVISKLANFMALPEYRHFIKCRWLLYWQCLWLDRWEKMGLSC